MLLKTSLCSRELLFQSSLLIERCSARLYVFFQVSILNGRDLKTLINYTGEQVSACCRPFMKALFWPKLLSFTQESF